MKTKIQNLLTNTFLYLTLTLSLFIFFKEAQKTYISMTKEPEVLVIKPKHNISVHVGASFSYFVKDFLNYAVDNKVILPNDFNQRLDSLTVKYGMVKKIDKHLAGYCDLHTITVIIDASLWKVYSDSQRQALIDHELGHCLLGRIHRHKATIYWDNSIDPHSIMYPTLLPGDYYQKHKNKFRKELFSHLKYDKFDYMRNLLSANHNELAKKFDNYGEYDLFIHNFVNGDIEYEGYKDIVQLVKEVHQH